MWVIKLGGSLIGAPELASWLDVVARNGDGKVIIVPGGGLFADAVRAAQRSTSVDDVTAHRMAVMAMDQYGVMMTGLNKQLVTADCELELAERGWQHLGIVWLPSRMVCAAEDISPSWDVTSDSLAVWLAKKIEATHLVLVKSVETTACTENAQTLIDRGWLDAQFKQSLQAASNKSLQSWVVHKSQACLFNESFNENQLIQHAVRIQCE